MGCPNTLQNFALENDPIRGITAKANGDFHEFISLLSGTGRDFLIRNNGEKVKIEKLKGKKLGLYFSASWCGPCQQFTPYLVEVYNELSSKGDFEVILVSADRHTGSFNKYFAKMPWLAIPFSDSEKRGNLEELFDVMGIPHLVIIDEKGKVLTDKGVENILEYGAEGYPFTPEKINEMKEQEAAAKKNQSLRSILVSPSRDFVISNDEKKVSVSELEGKMVGLYFFFPSYNPCVEFTPKLVEVYNKLKEKGESFEVVMICIDEDDEESFMESFRNTPWFALPFKDKRWQKLVRYFELRELPTLVIIGPDGKTLHSNVVEAIEDYGIQVYPFTPQKFAEIAEMEKAEVEKAGWPQKVKHALHDEHELVLTRRPRFICDGCIDEGRKWSFYCGECDFDLHPKCALEEDKKTKREPQEEIKEVNPTQIETTHKVTATQVSQIAAPAGGTVGEAIDKVAPTAGGAVAETSTGKENGQNSNPSQGIQAPAPAETPSKGQAATRAPQTASPVAQHPPPPKRKEQVPEQTEITIEISPPISTSPPDFNASLASANRASPISDADIVKIYVQSEEAVRSIDSESDSSLSLSHLDKASMQNVLNFFNLIELPFEELASTKSQELISCFTKVQSIAPTVFTQKYQDKQFSEMAKSLRDKVAKAQQLENEIKAKNEYIASIKHIRSSIKSNKEEEAKLEQEELQLSEKERELEKELESVTKQRRGVRQRREELAVGTKELVMKRNSGGAIEDAREEVRQAQFKLKGLTIEWDFFKDHFPRPQSLS